MHKLEKGATKTIARLSPWLAPLPSAYFVARSAMAHLALPLPVAIVVAVIIETLGLATVHTALWAYDWNAHKRKSDPAAPLGLAIVLACVYLVTTFGLVVFLEVWPGLATYAPGLFPFLAIVGTVNLALIARQEQRETEVDAQKAEARRQRQLSKSVSKTVSKTDAQGKTHGQPASVQNGVQNVQNRVLDALGASSLDAVNASRQERKAAVLDAILDIYRDDPDAGATAVSRKLGIGRSSVYNYLDELEDAGRIHKNGDGVKVLEL